MEQLEPKRYGNCLVTVARTKQEYVNSRQTKVIYEKQQASRGETITKRTVTIQ